MTVDEALEWADQVADNAPGATHEAILATEVRRLRAMLEPTPDARELAAIIESEGVSFDFGGGYHWDSAKVAKRIAAHDARLLDEAAERAIAWWRKGHPYNYKAHEAELRAAIKGAAHE